MRPQPDRRMDFICTGTFAVVVIAALLVWARALHAQPQVQAQDQPQRARDVLTGRVSGPRGSLEAATVVLWPSGDSTRRQTARTNADGRWLISVMDGAGDYAVRATSIGMKASNVRALRVTIGAPIIVNFRLDVNAVQLSAVRVVANNKPRAPRDNGQVNAASGDRTPGTQVGSVAGGDLGDLAALAASLPGIVLSDNGGSGAPAFSVPGLGPSSNNVTINGMLSTGSSIPRDALGTTVRVATTPWDVSRGGFSGGQVTVTLGSGGNVGSRVLRTTVDAPQLQATDAIGRGLGNSFTNVQVSGAASGAPPAGLRCRTAGR
jgi:hypothetical protein